MRTIDISTPSKRYQVTIGEGAISRLTACVATSSAVVVVTDETVARLHAEPACQPLQAASRTVLDWVIPPGEQSKSLWQAECLYDYLTSRRIDRRAAIVALGGGVVGDLAGFVASTWMRGVGFVYCPTTLLAAVDAAVGGKTALDHAGRKNVIGTFYQPDAVLIDPSFLKTLDARQFSSGMGESLKHGLIADAAFFDWQLHYAEAILRRDPSCLEELIARNVQIKAHIVQRDERDETGERAKLNFGHTIGHALEAASGYGLTHGECVGLGLRAATGIAVDRGLADAKMSQRIEEALEQFALPTRLPAGIELSHLMELIQQDKKSIEQKVRFVLPTRIGEVTSGHEVDDETILRALEQMQ